MKQISQTILYNISLVVIFFIIYSMIIEQFITLDKEKAATIDVLNLSVTLQTSVGNTFVRPTTSFAKIMITIQQFLLIFGNLFILHVYV